MDPIPSPRCGLIGPGRRRNGLGPFLVRDLEAAGASVVAIAGRDPERTADMAAQFAERYGHPVAAHTSVEGMVAEGLDAAVVASPIEAHLGALRVLGQAGLSVLAEKPLVAPEEHHLVPEIVASFAGRVLMENCPWPYALHVLPALYPELEGAPVEQVEMLLSPSGSGISTVVDTLSHFVSVVQHVVPVDASTVVTDVEVRGATEETECVEIGMAIESPFPRLRATLYLERCAAQPRPAWVALNGKRVDRRIQTRDYSISFWAGEQSRAVPDPMTALVADFVQLLREPDLERNRAEASAIRERGRLYRTILDAWRV